MVTVGMMSFAHMHAYSYAGALKRHPNARIAGVADHDADRARKMAESLETRAFSSYEELLGSDLDAVVICTENARHREMAEMAAAAGKAILCEKPLATRASDATAMVKAAAAANVPLWTAFPCRYHPSALAVKNRLADGSMGELWALRGTNRGRCPGGWFIDKALAGGGAVMDHTVHVTDLFRWLLGVEVVEVFCEATNRMFRSDFDDTGLVTLGFDNGLFATIDCSWSRPKSYPTWGDVTLEMVGEGGVLSLNMFAQDMTVYEDDRSRVTWRNWGSDMDAGLVSAFVAGVAGGTPAEVSGVDGLRTIEVVDAAYRSAETGEPVQVERTAVI